MNASPADSVLHLVSGRQHARETLAAYRPYTRALLRRYFRLAVDIGRLPSILGGLCFRARVSSYRLHTFEDSVIFVHDIERVFDRIERPAMEIIAGVVLLEYSVPEAALRLRITVQRAERRYASALDSLSAALLEVGLLRPVFTSEHPEDRAPAAGAAYRAAASGAAEGAAYPAPAHLLARARREDPSDPPPRKPPLSAELPARVPVSAIGVMTETQ
jgi:hypothetical protein